MFQWFTQCRAYTISVLKRIWNERFKRYIDWISPPAISLLFSFLGQGITFGYSIGSFALYGRQVELSAFRRWNGVTIEEVLEIPHSVRIFSRHLVNGLQYSIPGCISLYLSSSKTPSLWNALSFMSSCFLLGAANTSVIDLFSQWIRSPRVFTCISSVFYASAPLIFLGADTLSSSAILKAIMSYHPLISFYTEAKHLSACITDEVDSEFIVPRAQLHLMVVVAILSRVSRAVQVFFREGRGRSVASRTGQLMSALVTFPGDYVTNHSNVVIHAQYPSFNNSSSSNCNNNNINKDKTQCSNSNMEENILVVNKTNSNNFLSSENTSLNRSPSLHYAQQNPPSSTASMATNINNMHVLSMLMSDNIIPASVVDATQKLMGPNMMGRICFLFPLLQLFFSFASFHETSVSSPDLKAPNSQSYLYSNHHHHFLSSDGSKPIHNQPPPPSNQNSPPPKKSNNQNSASQSAMWLPLYPATASSPPLPPLSSSPVSLLNTSDFPSLQSLNGAVRSSLQRPPPSSLPLGLPALVLSSIPLAVAPSSPSPVSPSPLPLSRVSFTAHTGDLISIISPSGSGKSTFLTALALGICLTTSQPSTLALYGQTSVHLAKLDVLMKAAISGKPVISVPGAGLTVGGACAWDELVWRDSEFNPIGVWTDKLMNLPELNIWQGILRKVGKWRRNYLSGQNQNAVIQDASASILKNPNIVQRSYRRPEEEVLKMVDAAMMNDVKSRDQKHRQKRRAFKRHSIVNDDCGTTSRVEFDYSRDDYCIKENGTETGKQGKLNIKSELSQSCPPMFFPGVTSYSFAEKELNKKSSGELHTTSQRVSLFSENDVLAEEKYNAQSDSFFCENGNFSHHGDAAEDTDMGHEEDEESSEQLLDHLNSFHGNSSFSPSPPSKSPFLSLARRIFAPRSRPLFLQRLRLLRSLDEASLAPFLNKPRIGFAPEPGQIDWDPSLTPHQILMLTCGVRGLSDVEALSESSRLLSALNMQSAADQPCYSLTASQERCLAVACACAASPLLILLDNPFAGLSVRERLCMSTLLHWERRFKGSIIIVAAPSATAVFELNPTHMLCSDGLKPFVSLTLPPTPSLSRSTFIVWVVDEPEVLQTVQNRIHQAVASSGRISISINRFAVTDWCHPAASGHSLCCLLVSASQDDLSSILETLHSLMKCERRSGCREYCSTSSGEGSYSNSESDEESVDDENNEFYVTAFHIAPSISNVDLPMAFPSPSQPDSVAQVKHSSSVQTTCASTHQSRASVLPLPSPAHATPFPFVSHLARILFKSLPSSLWAGFQRRLIIFSALSRLRTHTNLRSIFESLGSRLLYGCLWMSAVTIIMQPFLFLRSKTPEATLLGCALLLFCTPPFVSMEQEPPDFSLLLSLTAIPSGVRFAVSILWDLTFCMTEPLFLTVYLPLMSSVVPESWTSQMKQGVVAQAKRWLTSSEAQNRRVQSTSTSQLSNGEGNSNPDCDLKGKLATILTASKQSIQNSESPFPLKEKTTSVFDFWLKALLKADDSLNNDLGASSDQQLNSGSSAPGASKSTAASSSTGSSSTHHNPLLPPSTRHVSEVLSNIKNQSYAVSTVAAAVTSRPSLQLLPFADWVYFAATAGLFACSAVAQARVLSAWLRGGNIYRRETRIGGDANGQGSEACAECRPLAVLAGNIAWGVFVIGFELATILDDTVPNPASAINMVITPFQKMVEASTGDIKSPGASLISNLAQSSSIWKNLVASYDRSLWCALCSPYVAFALSVLNYTRLGNGRVYKSNANSWNESLFFSPKGRYLIVCLMFHTCLNVGLAWAVTTSPVAKLSSRINMRFKSSMRSFLAFFGLANPSLSIKNTVHCCDTHLQLGLHSNARSSLTHVFKFPPLCVLHHKQEPLIQKTIMRQSISNKNTHSLPHHSNSTLASTPLWITRCDSLSFLCQRGPWGVRSFSLPSPFSSHALFYPCINNNHSILCLPTSANINRYDKNPSSSSNSNKGGGSSVCLNENASSVLSVTPGRPLLLLSSRSGSGATAFTNAFSDAALGLSPHITLRNMGGLMECPRMSTFYSGETGGAVRLPPLINLRSAMVTIALVRMSAGGDMASICGLPSLPSSLTTVNAKRRMNNRGFSQLVAHSSSNQEGHEDSKTNQLISDDESPFPNHQFHSENSSLILNNDSDNNNNNKNNQVYYEENSSLEVVSPLVVNNIIREVLNRISRINEEIDFIFKLIGLSDEFSPSTSAFPTNNNGNHFNSSTTHYVASNLACQLLPSSLRRIVSLALALVGLPVGSLVVLDVPLDGLDDHCMAIASRFLSLACMQHVCIISCRDTRAYTTLFSTMAHSHFYPKLIANLPLVPSFGALPPTYWLLRVCTTAAYSDSNENATDLSPFATSVSSVVSGISSKSITFLRTYFLESSSSSSSSPNGTFDAEVVIIVWRATCLSEVIEVVNECKKGKNSSFLKHQSKLTDSLQDGQWVVELKGPMLDF